METNETEVRLNAILQNIKNALPDGYVVAATDMPATSGTIYIEATAAGVKAVAENDVTDKLQSLMEMSGFALLYVSSLVKSDGSVKLQLIYYLFAPYHWWTLRYCPPDEYDQWLVDTVSELDAVSRLAEYVNVHAALPLRYHEIMESLHRVWCAKLADSRQEDDREALLVALAGMNAINEAVTAAGLTAFKECDCEYE